MVTGQCGRHGHCLPMPSPHIWLTFDRQSTFVAKGIHSTVLSDSELLVLHQFLVGVDACLGEFFDELEFFHVG